MDEPADNSLEYIVIGEKIKIVRWKIAESSIVYDGRILLIYETVHENITSAKPVLKKLKSKVVGKVKKLMIKEGEIVDPKTVLLILEKGCSHPTVINDLCAECGADLQEEKSVENNHASVSMIHAIPALKVSEEQARILGKADEARLLKDRKLVLLVDLDQTLIHTTNDNIPNNFKDVYHFQLYGPKSPWYHTRLRPNTHQFLSRVSQKYELHICTFGSRNYAHMIAHFLDPDKIYFSHRILSRDECFDPNSKTANMRALFPCGDNLVCIIDDREDVWEYAPNLIHVKPYHFFQHTGDINAPPGFTKFENDVELNSEFIHLAHGITAKKRNKIRQIVDNINLSSSNMLDGVTFERRTSKANSSPRSVTSSELLDVTGYSKEEIENQPINSDEKKFDAENQTEIKENGNEVINIEEIVEQSSVCNKDYCETIVNHKLPVESEEISNDCEDAAEKELIHLELSSQKEIGSISLISKSDEDIKKNLNDKDVQKDEGDAPEKDMPPKVINESTGTSDTDVGEEEKINADVAVLTGAEIVIGGHVVKTEWDSTPPTDDLIELEEQDDYLLYLEEILHKIYAEFYAKYDLCEEMPDLKEIVPKTRSSVLKGVNIVFSGVVPNSVNLEDSRPYNVAVSLGAKVTENLEPDTTHLVAVRKGTSKVRTARKIDSISIVTPEWLWMCAERWEKVDERLYPIAKNKLSSRIPPAHCSSPDHSPPASPSKQIIQQGRFIDSINPLMSFSTEDIAKMSDEVDDIFNEPESDGEDKNNMLNCIGKKRKHDLTQSSFCSSSSSDDLDENHSRKLMRCVESHRRVARRRRHDDDETIMDKFRRGENLPSDLDLGENSDSDDRAEEFPAVSDDEWNIMGAELEREFLEGNDQ